MSKYINADEFLKKYNEIDLKPYISDKGYAQMIDGYEFWEKWKEEYDRTVRRIVSELLYIQENEDAIIGKIKEIPIAQTLSADVVEVVRCKDCKYWEYKCQGDFEHTYGDCLYWQIEHCSDFYMETTGNHYCGFARKRKETEW